MRRFLSERWEKNLIAALLAAIVLFMLAEAACRHLWPGMHQWPLKAAGGCLAWMASLGIARAAALGAHIKVSVLEQSLPAEKSRYLARFADAAFLLFCLVSLIIGCVVLFRSLTRADTPGHPLVYAAIPVGSALAIQRLWRRLRGPGPGDGA